MLLSRPQAVSLTKVVVASRGIDAYTALSSENLKLIDWPQDNLPVGAKSNIDYFSNRQLSVNLSSGELILDSLLVPIATANGMAASISTGKRAISLSVNEAAEVAGFPLPGNYVDILLNTKDPAGLSFSKIIVQHVLILAIGQDRSIKDPTKAKVANMITLEVTPDEAEKIDMARSIGSLSLVLRNQSDNRPADSEGSSQSTLYPRSSVIEIIRGKERTLEKALNH